jgi:FkbM family methyltransferase
MALAKETYASLREEFFGHDLREQSVLDSFTRLLPGHGRFIDVGANVGQYTYFANKHLSNAEIISIEANPNLIDPLRDTIAKAEAEDAHHNRFRVVNNIVSDREETVPFYVDPHPTTSSIFSKADSSRDASSRSALLVRSVKLDDFYDESLKTFVKMDIEGAEYRALAGSKRFLDSRLTTFLVEVHPWGDVELRRYPIHVATLMFLHGYRMKKVVPHYFFGSHYVFSKSGLLPRLVSYIYYTPVLIAEFVVYRYFPRSSEGITEVLRRLFKRSRKAA